MLLLGFFHEVCPDPLGRSHLDRFGTCMTAAGEATSLEFRRVQRPTQDLPVVHLEPEVPVRDLWRLEVDGLVERPVSWTAEEIRRWPAEERVWDLNCVWGWVRPACRWEGVPGAALIDAAGPLPEARFVMAEAAGGAPGRQATRLYASCLTIEEARRSLLAWRLDAEDLTPEHGGPLRLVTPPEKWGYKGVKWLARLTLTDKFSPGFWEEMVGNPVGDIPPDLLDNRLE